MTLVENEIIKTDLDQLNLLDNQDGAYHLSN